MHRHPIISIMVVFLYSLSNQLPLHKVTKNSKADKIAKTKSVANSFAKIANKIITIEASETIAVNPLI